MPTYGKNNFKESNVNYLNKDFTALKSSLINYAKSYFPDTYRDFNETSPGMMLIEMNAYVGDTLSFYIDQQYREMLLPLAEERRNILTMAKMFGYKVKPIVPAFVDLTFKSVVNANVDNRAEVDYSDAGTFDEGIEIPASNNGNIIFSTIEPIDFTITGSSPADTSVINTTDTDSGLALTYILERTVRAISGKQKTKTFQIGVPEKFKTITIPDTDVIDLISCIDSNGQDWYEVDFLAQDKVPISKHWTEESRTSAYQNLETLTNEELAVPYSLSYLAKSKRFVRETNVDNTTSLVFGNGILRDGVDGIEQDYIDMEQVGIIIPGQTNDLNNAINPLLGNEYSTLGETPSNTTLTITYRVGGGVISNVNSGMLSTKPTTAPSIANNTIDAEIESVTNNNPARGGRNEEDTLEIKEKAKAFFSTQNRCVTKEDYEARVMNIPAKYGNIAKVYVSRNVEGEFGYDRESVLTALSNFTTYRGDIEGRIVDVVSRADFLLGNEGKDGTLEDLRENANYLKRLIQDGATDYPLGMQEYITNIGELIPTSEDSLNLSAIQIYILAYNDKKQLVGNANTSTTGTNDNLPLTLTTNISSYLQNFRLLTDVIAISDGYIINFGVFFDVIAEKYANKQEVKLKCIQKIKDYFKIEKMQFNQPIYKSNLEFELMGVEGVRSIGHVTLTQYEDYFFEGGDVVGGVLGTQTFTYSFDPTGGDGTGAYVQATGENIGVGYNYKYDFKNALSTDGTIIRPPLPSTPSVFELKNPNQNIQGRVR